VSSGRATLARTTSLKIFCDQLQHTQQNLACLEQEIGSLLEQDPGVKGLQGIREFGPKTMAVLRAELGDVERFSRCDQVIAYAGLDITMKESGKWRGQRKLVLARQWETQEDFVSGRCPLCSAGGISLWRLLSSPGSARCEEVCGAHRRDAQAACGDLSSLENPGGI
jgi:hypothetical protein